MDAHYGQRLIKARTERGLTVEEAAHITRINAQYIRALEEGNLTKFPNAAYAKSFLLMYAKHLGINVKQDASTIDTSTQMKVEDFQYLTTRAREQQKELAAAKEEPEDRYGFVVPERGSRSWTPLFIIAGAVGVAVLAFIIWSNVNRLDETPAPSPATADTSRPPQATPDPEPPRPKVVSPPKTAPAANHAAVTAPPANAVDPSIPTAIPVAKAISPVARMAANDAAALADIPSALPDKPATPAPVTNSVPAPTAPAAIEEENPARVEDPNMIILEPQRKSWVVIRSTPGGSPLFEDYLYPNAKPLRLPAGKYFIEFRDSTAIDISKAGRRISYRPPGMMVE